MLTKAVVARGGSGIEAMELREVPQPEPGPGEVLVRLTAATLNHRDLLFARGVLPGLTKPRNMFRCPALRERSLRLTTAWIG